MLLARERQELDIDLTCGTCVTIGNFDGVHKGHQKLIDRVLHKARAQGLLATVVSFCPHPLHVLVGPKTPPFITLRDHKLDIIESLGVDITLLLNFTRQMAALDPEEFVKTYLVDWINTKELVVGYDYSFGKGRKGNYALLQTLGERYGFTVERHEPVIINDAIVSSTRIRDLIRSGDVWAAAALLGRFYVVEGRVVHGKNRGGRLLGFPTANLELDNALFPETGVYAGWVELDDVCHAAVANVGYSPTFGNEEKTVEAHILDFNRDVYGCSMRFHFVQRLREERKFANLTELVARIREDAALARQVLSAPEAQL